MNRFAESLLVAFLLAGVYLFGAYMQYRDDSNHPKVVVVQHTKVVTRYHYVPFSILENVCKAEDDAAFKEAWEARGKLP